MVVGSINSCPFAILTFSTQKQTKKNNVSKIILVNMVWRRLFHGYVKYKCLHNRELITAGVKIEHQVTFTM